MSLYRLLQSPFIYDLKTRILSFGRRNVRDYLLGTPIARSADSRILDVGCGTGRHAAISPGFFWGIDLNPRYIRHARKCYPGTFLVMNATHLAFSGDRFDLVFCAGLCHHLSDNDVRTTAREMIRVTKQGGQVLIIDGVFPTKANFLGRLLFTFDRGHHTRTLETLATLLAQEGFELITENIEGSFPYRRAVFSHRKPGNAEPLLGITDR